MKKLTQKQCLCICELYYKCRKRIYERGLHSIDSIAKQFGIASDTCRRIIKGMYKIEGKPFKPRKFGFCKTKYKPAARPLKGRK